MHDVDALRGVLDRIVEALLAALECIDEDVVNSPKMMAHQT
jgi:hypothetical protein